MKRKILILVLSALAALGLCLGVAACSIIRTDSSRLGDEHLLYEKNEAGDGYIVTGLEEGCTDTDIVIPATHEGLPVTAIGQEAFEKNETIETVDLPDSIEKIGNFAFAGCPALRHVDFGCGLESIGVQSFDSCALLKDLVFPEGLREIDAFAFEYCTSLKEVVIPDSVIRIGASAFYSCTSLAKATLGEGLKSIGAFAFAFTSIEEVVVPNLVTDLGIVCFGYNGSLRSATLGWGCTGIPYGIFYNCTSLETVAINNVCLVCDSAFGNCEGLRTVFFIADKDTWEKSCTVGTESDDNPENGYGNTTFHEADLYFYSEEPNFDGEHWGYVDGQRTIWRQQEAADPHLLFELNEAGTAYTVTGLEEECAHKRIVIPATYKGLPVTTIGQAAFWGKSEIEEVVLPSEIAELEYGAFCYCEGLKTINLPKRLKTIGDFTFFGCTALETAELPIALREVGFGAFEECTGLERVFIPRRVVFDHYVFCGCTALSEVTFEEGFDGLSAYAFAQCTSLTHVELPESLTKIGPFAFCESGLEEVDIPKGVETIGTVAFAKCANLTKVTFHEGLRYIEAYAFQRTSLSEVIIPEGVYQIGLQAFAFIDELENVVLGSKILASCGYAAFRMCPELKTVTIMNPDGMISDAVFAGCTKLETVYFNGFAGSGPEMSWDDFLRDRINQDSLANPVNSFGNKPLYEVATVYYYSEEPNYDGSHWHLDENGLPVVWSE